MQLTFLRFQQLRPRAQLVHVLMAGTHMANRWNGLALLTLYHCGDGGKGFFAEVGLDEVQDCFVVLRSFSSSVPLADYAHGVRLPEG